MEIFIFLSLMTVAFFAITWFFVLKFRSIQAEDFGKAIADNLLVLKPENRYIISFPFEISDEEFDKIVEEITGSLDLENSDTHVVIVQGHVNMIEFS